MTDFAPYTTIILPHAVHVAEGTLPKGATVTVLSVHRSHLRVEVTIDGRRILTKVMKADLEPTAH